MDTRLRVERAIEKTEEEVAPELMKQVNDIFQNTFRFSIT